MSELYEVNERPWGSWKIVHREGLKTVKILTINPGHMLSLQSHENRIEQWLPLSPGLIAYIGYSRKPEPWLLSGGEATALDPGAVFEVGTGEVHRLINAGKARASLVETIFGRYDEEDITRYHDAYGRL